MRGRPIDATGIVGAAAIASIRIHGALDDVLHQPLITMTAAALA